MTASISATRTRAFVVSAWRAGGVLATVLLLGFLALPLLALFTATGPGGLVSGLRHPLVGPALALSLFTTSTSVVIVTVLGTPAAWMFARRPGSRRVRAAETLVQLPMVLPPAVAGVALLLAFGRRGLVARLLPFAHESLAFTTAAVVMAEVFVSAPFFIQAATSAFRRVDGKLIDVARSLGASPPRVFLRVVLPLAAPGLVSGAAMSWARSLGEFGATLMFAGNLTGRTQTLPLAIYTALESDLRVADALAVVLVIVAFLLLLIVRSGAARVSRLP